MKFTDIFIQRPVLAIVIAAVMLLVGIQAGTQLSLREYPEVEKSHGELRFPGGQNRPHQEKDWFRFAHEAHRRQSGAE